MLQRLRASLRLIVVAAALAAVPALVFSNLVLGGEIGHVRARYERTRANIDGLNMRLQDVEANLRRLSSSVPAVEQEVRRQFRLVKPGESLVLLEYAD